MKLNTLTLFKYLGFVPAALGAVVMAGCAAMAPATPEQAVAKRATAYWEARTQAQYEKAYALSTPSYRALRTAEQFKLQFGAGANIQSAEVVGVTCEPEKCVAKMKLRVKPVIIGLKLDTMDTFLDEIWLLEDGQWWHHQDL